MCAAERRYRIRGAPIIHDTIDNETIAINQQTGAYYSLEGPAALAWLTLAEGATPSEVSHRLASRYEAAGQPLEAAVADFLAELLAEALIMEDLAEPADAAGRAGPPNNGAADPPPADRPIFSGLRLQRYTDLEVMLLADPIHEVDDSGWPMPHTDDRR